MGYANTKFKVGDKVRMLDVSSVMFGSKYFTNGNIYEVLRVDGDGRPFIGGANCADKDACEVGLLFTSSEFHAIELVKEGDKLTQQYRTEKRKARVGERILITNAETTFGDYQNGDVFTVKRNYRKVGVMSEELKGDAPYIGHSEYEVIVGELASHNESLVLTRLFDAEAQIDELQRKASALEDKVKAVEAQLADKPAPITFNTSVTTAPVKATSMRDFAESFRKLAEITAKVGEKTLTLTPIQRRADVIKQAREFVAEHTKHNGKAGYKSGVLVGHYVTFPEFIVNAEKRTVVVLMKGVNGSHPVFAKGIAKCAPDDVFNADIGKAIALGRAKGVEIPQEFFNAPKPTEFVVGMVVKYFKDGGFKFTYDVNSHVLDTIRRDAVESSIWDVKIVDDTEAQYEALA